jgi:hypothetical protein
MAIRELQEKEFKSLHQSLKSLCDGTWATRQRFQHSGW